MPEARRREIFRSLWLFLRVSLFGSARAALEMNERCAATHYLKSWVRSRIKHAIAADEAWVLLDRNADGADSTPDNNHGGSNP